MMATMLADPVARGDTADVLHAILDPDCALAIWDRALPAALVADLAALDPDSVDDIDAVVRTDSAPVAVAVLLGGAGYDPATALMLATEIGTSAERLARLAPVERFRIRLEIVTTDACRRFHADSVTLRLLVTLYGPGTQWIRTADPDTIEQVATGAVALFKGRLLLDDPTILHRSPPVAGTGLHRLMLAIDPV